MRKVRNRLPEIMREQKHAVAAEESRPVHDVRTPLADQLDQLGKFFRRVFRVGVLDDDQIPRHFVNPSRSADPLPPFGFWRSLKVYFFCSSRRISDVPSLDPSSTTISSMRMPGTASTRANHPFDGVALVVDGHDDREQRVGE